MTSRFEPAPQQTEDFIEKVKAKFENLNGINVISVFDTKKKASAGKILVARIKKMGDELKFFAMHNDGTTYDYILFIDKLVWGELDERDRRRVVSHEFHHCDIDFNKKNPCGIRGHEVETFYEEIDANEDDPQWAERVNDIADYVYEPEDE